MDYAVQTQTYTPDDLTWLGTYTNLHGHPATIATGALVQATHYPDGYVKAGTLVALHTGGGFSGLWGPWVEDGANGSNVIGGVVYSGFEVRLDATGSPVSTRTTGTILLPEDGLRLITAKLPNLLLADGTTVNVVSDANVLAGGFGLRNLGV